MDMADEMDVRRKLRQDALAAVGAVARNEQVAFRKPRGGQGNQFDGQLGTRAMVGRSFSFLDFLITWFLLALGEPLTIAIEAFGDGQGEDFGGCPKRMNDDDTQDDPIVPPTDEWLGPAGDERVVMHAGAVDGQPAFAAQGVIDGKQERAGGRKDACDEYGQAHVEEIEVPRSVAEEAMKACPMAVSDIAAGKDDVRDVAMAMGEDPPATDLREGTERRRGENGVETD